MMVKGIVFALSACFLWGFTFIVPGFMNSFSSMEIAIGRYMGYGLISSLFFVKSKLQGMQTYSKQIWLKAFYLSFISSIVYYMFVVLCLRFSTPAICALILGMSPITIAFYGNIKDKSISFRSLVFPSVLIFIGLAIINFPHLLETSDKGVFTIGLVCGFLALVIWTLYTVGNACFLKKHPQVPFMDWAIIIGVATFIWTIIFTIVLGTLTPQEFRIEKFFHSSDSLGNFLIGSFILGAICSWIGSYWWNKASFYLPVSLTGQMMIFQTIFGVFFAYLFKQTLPTLVEGVGISLLLFAIIYGIRGFSRTQDYSTS